ncbi:MAG: hypothetical protein U5R49_06055 [Deltaproteobacteria bacterium]|nr:hypothetical protein [Deltaproteobacteria bacterium]
MQDSLRSTINAYKEKSGFSSLLHAWEVRSQFVKEGFEIRTRVEHPMNHPSELHGRQRVPVQPQYHLPELRGRRGKEDGLKMEVKRMRG